MNVWTVCMVHSFLVYIVIFRNSTARISDKLIWHTIGPKSFLFGTAKFFGPDGAVDYDYIITNSINSLLIGSSCIPNGAHTPNLAHALYQQLWYYSEHTYPQRQTR